MGNERKQSDDEMRLQANSSALNEPTSDDAPQDSGVALPTEAQGLIGHQLRQEYKRLLSEPLPGKFAKLLDDLAQSERKSERKE